ncbi:acyl-CoA dehydrogenase [Streptomyces sp. SBT349]|uniref:acyl-CoA dehydrogenase n=1 Tax=Streptomyces sp. SBT349 TaxID=1580539 RepID=UPI00066E4311|nr:acyl-CoA dehydrogenase [Streptomyces sp. SBT349]
MTGAPSRPPSTFDLAAEFERRLGCPFDPGAAMSLAGGVRADALGAEPAAAYEAAWSAGLHEHIVPVAEGGRLASFEEFLGVVRAVSRREPAVSVGLGSTLLAAMPVWIWGDDEQRRRVAELVLARAWGTAAISERSAGSDLLATRTRATPAAGGYVLDGEKWMVGNGRRSSFATVLAASEPSFGLFLLDFAALGGELVRRLPKIPTHGLRGHDLSGLALSGCRVGPAALLGRRGRGVEMLTGMLQFTRTMVGAVSLGAADTALRIALRHARTRVLYGVPASTLPPVRSLLARGFADLLVAECTGLAATRALDVARQRMPLWSAVAKYVVPAFCVDAVNACGEVLSARAYVREGVANDAFQKVARDIAITPVFEGTQLVQLDTIRAQLADGALRRGRGATDAGLPLSLLFRFGEPAPSPAPRDQRPSITYGGTDEVTDFLDDAAGAVADDEDLAALARRLVTVRDETRETLAAVATRRTPEAYEAARRHCLVHAGACCLHTWIRRRESLGGLATDRAWLSVALRRVVERLGLPARPDWAGEDRLVRRLEELDDDDRALSLVPLRLAAQYRESAPAHP